MIKHTLNFTIGQSTNKPNWQCLLPVHGGLMDNAHCYSNLCIWAGDVGYGPQLHCLNKCQRCQRSPSLVYLKRSSVSVRVQGIR